MSTPAASLSLTDRLVATCRVYLAAGHSSSDAIRCAIGVGRAFDLSTDQIAEITVKVLESQYRITRL